ncbi:MAG TPA: sterol desaturase family protein [Vicinamibacteria bacterium]|nr:sterol desaturase family protein [Vicinamibacteria bacterium]
MPEHRRRFLPWIAYPGVVITAFALHFVLLRVGLPVGVSAYIAVVLGAVAVTILELVIPYDASWQPTRDDVKNDLLFMIIVQIVLPPLLTLFFGITLIRSLQAFDVSTTEWWPRHLPLAVQVVLMLLVAELFRYWLHVAAHNTALWRLHAVHHSPRKLYWLNVGRFHPVEKALQFLLDALPFIVLGVGEEVFAGYFIFYAVNGFFQHSNVDARYGILNYVVSGAELHRWHHSRQIEESNNNYGNNFIVWDLVFGSWFLPRDRRVGALGLLNPEYPLDFVSQLTTPLRPGLDKQGAASNAI